MSRRNSGGSGSGVGGRANLEHQLVSSLSQQNLSPVSCSSHVMSGTTQLQPFPLLPFCQATLASPAALSGFQASPAFIPSILSPEYLLHLSAICNLKGVPSSSVVPSAEELSRLENESFMDVLRKMPKAPVSAPGATVKSENIPICSSLAVGTDPSNFGNGECSSPLIDEYSSGRRACHSGKRAAVATASSTTRKTNKTQTDLQHQSNGCLSEDCSTCHDDEDVRRMIVGSKATDKSHCDSCGKNVVLDFSKKRILSASNTSGCKESSKEESERKRTKCQHSRDSAQNSGICNSSSTGSKGAADLSSGMADTEQKYFGVNNLSEQLTAAAAVAAAAAESSFYPVQSLFTNRDHFMLTAAFPGELFPGASAVHYLPTGEPFPSSDAASSSQMTSTDDCTSCAPVAQPSSFNRSRSARRSVRGRPATISADDGSEAKGGGKSKDGQRSESVRSTVDDTIDNVLRHQNVLAANMADRIALSVAASTVAPRSRGRGGGREFRRGHHRCAFTVREQLALRRAQLAAATAAATKNAFSLLNCLDSNRILNNCSSQQTALDLSNKCHSKPVLVDRLKVKENVQQSLVQVTEVCSKSVNTTPSPRTERKKPMAVNIDLIKIPLSRGWRRQTTVRNISATGVRGEVMYYGPCGKRMCSYAEILKYIQKNRLKDLAERHFSLSSKVIAGEYLCSKDSGDSRVLAKLSESEILYVMQLIEVALRKGVLKSPEPPKKDKNEKGFASCWSFSSASRGSIASYSSLPNNIYHNSDDSTSSFSESLISAEERKTAQEILRDYCANKPMYISYNTKPSRSEEKAQRSLACLSEMKKHQAVMVQTPTISQEEDEANRRCAEKVIQREERRAARIAYMSKVRQLRQPVEDLEVEGVKTMPRLKRIRNLRLGGQAFADLLMVVEFINTFGSVLKVDKSEIPTIDALHAALLNDEEHAEALRSLTKILLTLVLEYPSLSNGCQTKLFTGQALRDVCVNNSNMSELIRLFLYARDDSGQRLARLLDDNEFDTLSGEEKISILAYMTNELLYCRNVVREIENNIDVVAKLKGDKWSYESRIRALRHAHARKLEQAQDGTSTSMETRSVDEKKPKMETIESETKSIQETSEPLLGDQDMSFEDFDLSVEELEKKIDNLKQEAGEVRRNISRTILKIRSLPCGQDRFMRYYWVLPNTGGVLVESVESSAANNPACSSTSLQLLQTRQLSIVDDDIRATVGALCRTIADVNDESDEDPLQRYFEVSSKEKTERSLLLDDDPPADDMTKGWWMLKKGEALDAVHDALTPRGIRERLFNRSFTKHGDLFKKNAFDDPQKLLQLHRPVAAAPQSSADILQRTFKEIQHLEEKVYAANIQVQGWAPPSYLERMGGKTSPPSESAEPLTLEVAKQRILDVERHIERRYLLPSFNGSQLKLNISQLAEYGEDLDQEYDKPLSSFASRDVQNADADIPLALATWRSGVTNAMSASQLSMCIDALDSRIAWEKSAMKASCQICRSGENESQLLLCDGCDMGYHMYCFKPQMEHIPDSDWYCPVCISNATKRPCCLICCHQSLRPMIRCSLCRREYHIHCLSTGLPKSPKKDWICQGCDNVRRSEKKNGCFLSPAPSAKSSTSSSSQRKRKKSSKSSDSRQNDQIDESNERTKFEENCMRVLDDLDSHRDSWPFKAPVDTKLFPLYKKVIKKPMDLSTIRSKLLNHKYSKSEDFIKDVHLIFDNCSTFNEDSSPVGIAGYYLREFFKNRWSDLDSANRANHQPAKR